VRQVIERHLCLRGDAIEQRPPSLFHHWRDGVHTGVGDERGHAERNLCPMPSRSPSRRRSWPSAMSASESPRCLANIVLILMLNAGRLSFMAFTSRSAAQPEALGIVQRCGQDCRRAFLAEDIDREPLAVL